MPSHHECGNTNVRYGPTNQMRLLGESFRPFSYPWCTPFPISAQRYQHDRQGAYYGI